MHDRLEPKYAEILGRIRSSGSTPSETATAEHDRILLEAMLAQDFMASFDKFRKSMDEGSRKANRLAWALFLAAFVQAAVAVWPIITKYLWK